MLMNRQNRGEKRIVANRETFHIRLRDLNPIGINLKTLPGNIHHDRRTFRACRI